MGRRLDIAEVMERASSMETVLGIQFLTELPLTPRIRLSPFLISAA